MLKVYAPIEYYVTDDKPPQSSAVADAASPSPPPAAAAVVVEKRARKRQLVWFLLRFLLLIENVSSLKIKKHTGICTTIIGICATWYMFQFFFLIKNSLIFVVESTSS